MRVLRVHDLASELDLLPGEMGVMITLGNMAGLAQNVYVPDSTTIVEITSSPDRIVLDNALEGLRIALKKEIQRYLDAKAYDRIDSTEIADLCLSIIQQTPRYS